VASSPPPSRELDQWAPLSAVPACVYMSVRVHSLILCVYIFSFLLLLNPLNSTLSFLSLFSLAAPPPPTHINAQLLKPSTRTAFRALAAGVGTIELRLLAVRAMARLPKGALLAAESGRGGFQGHAQRLDRKVGHPSKARAPRRWWTFSVECSPT